MLKKVLRTLKKVAPVAASVATATGILPPGVAAALKLAPAASHDDIEAAVIKADPTQLAELRRIDADLEKSMAENGLQRFQAEAADRDSARKREIAVGDSTPRIFAWVALGGFLGLVFLLAFKSIPDSTENLIYAAVGILGTILTAVCQYYFGSSSGSKSKDDVVHEVARAAAKRGA